MKPAIVLLEGIAAALAKVDNDPVAADVFCRVIGAGVARAMEVLRAELAAERERDARQFHSWFAAFEQLETRLVALEKKGGAK